MSLQYACFFLSGEVWWRLKGTETITRPLASLGGLAIVSPLASKYPFHAPGDMNPIFALRKGAAGFLFRSQTLSLACEESATSDQQIRDAPSMIARFLCALRVVAGQSQLPRYYCAYSPFESDPPEMPHEPPSQVHDAMVRKYMCSVAVQWDHLSCADDLVNHDSVPIHGELICDAVESFMANDYRSSMLFSAMAIEACAGSVLDREYEQLLSTSVDSSAHRVVTIRVNASESIRQDPIYLALRGSGGDGGSRFLSLLHEVPQYLLQRSLKIQEPDLYRQTHALYRTRNQIAHTGVVAPQNNMLQIGHDGARTALETANEVIAWFGGAPIPTPCHEMVDVGHWG